MTSKMTSGFSSDKTQAAAQRLVTLLNTRPHAGHPDVLVAGGEGIEAIRRQFAGNAQDMDATDLAQVARLRDALVMTLVDDASVEAAEAWEQVSELIGSATVRRVFTPSGVELHPAAGSAILGAIADAIHDVVDADSWSRIRFCPNHQCDLAFFDTTRSRTQKWDSYETCGNKANVSAHRARIRDNNLA